MRHPLSTPEHSGGLWEWSERVVAVGGVDGFVVEDVLVQAVPEHFEPPVSQRAQRCVVALSRLDLGVVELSGPGASAQAAERPLMDGGAEVAVVGKAPRNDEVALAGAPGDGRSSCVAPQRVRRRELLDVVSDLARDPGGETITHARHAQVDLAARDGVPRVGGSLTVWSRTLRCPPSSSSVHAASQARRCSSTATFHDDEHGGAAAAAALTVSFRVRTGADARGTTCITQHFGTRGSMFGVVVLPSAPPLLIVSVAAYMPFHVPPTMRYNALMLETPVPLGT